MTILRPPLGPTSVEQFLRDHWQRRPLLVRAAFAPEEVDVVDRQSLFELAGRDDVESRVIRGARRRWQLAHGPFDALPPPAQRYWTLLVQGVDLHREQASRLLQRFRFVPDARLDDLMASWASDRGGVGAHADSYDVFLIQAHGRRRWRVAPPSRSGFIAGLPVKILAHFEPIEEWLLEPGDMLYLPPGWGHEGVAVGECVTLSVGFRAPSRHEFLQAMLAAASDEPGGPDPRFADPRRPATRAPGAIPADLAGTLEQWARDWKPDAALLERFIGSFLTEPKASVWFERPRPLTPARFAARGARVGIALDRRTRIGYRRGLVFVNGEAFDAPPAPRRWLRRLADRRALTAAECAEALREPLCAAMLLDWYLSGWLAWPDER